MTTKGSHIQFKDVPKGHLFECWGDYHSFYNYPKWIVAVKDTDSAGTEIDDGKSGVRFCMNDSDEVWYAGQEYIRT